MIDTLTLRNFKAFSEEVSARLADLVVLAGANSSGKTSLLQAILLLSQTLENSRRDVVLDLGGPLVQFAEFRDVVFGRPPNSQARFSVGFHLSLNEPDLLQMLAQAPEDTAESLRRSRLSSSRPSLRFSSSLRSELPRPSRIELTFGATNNGRPLVHSLVLQKDFIDAHSVTHRIESLGRKYRATITNTPTKPRNQREITRFAKQIASHVLRLSETGLSPSADPSLRSRPSLSSIVDKLLVFQGLGWDPNLESLTPLRAALAATKTPLWRYAAPGLALDFGQICSDIVRLVASIPMERSLLLPLAFDHFFPGASASYREIDPRTDVYLNSFVALFGDAIVDVRRYLRSIEYVGPLRAKPERAYLPSGTPPDIGRSGENAVPILWLEQQSKVLTKSRLGAVSTRKRLGTAVQEWFEEFGVAQSLHVTSPKRVIYQATLDGPPRSGTRVTIADVGIGVSQLLPVVVSGLRAQPGATIVLEQPEIHLHPRIQAKLADFLLVLVELEKRVIVETHSEHLINALRLRVAEDPSGGLQNKLSILFVQGQDLEDTTSRPGSRLSSLEVDAYGHVVNWPEDFFPEYADMNERLLTAMIARARKKR